MLRVLLGAALLVALVSSLPTSNDFSVKVSVDAKAKTTPFPHVWERCVGSGHALLGTRVDWREHLERSRREIGFERVRFHGIFDDDMSVLYEGKHQWYNVDFVYDYIVSIGMHPLVELSFMPKELAGCDDIKLRCSYVFDNHGAYKGLQMPPQNYDDWYKLVKAFTQHVVDRYGLELVSQWKFEVWNEMWGMDYPKLYLPLYNASALAIKSVHPSIPVGGPATMQLLDVQHFIEDTQRLNLPVDFVSSHLYPSDPQCTNTTELREEADCFVRLVKEATEITHKAKLPFYLTEFNDGLQSGVHRDTSFAAAFLFRMVPKLTDTELISWWTFSDVFEENSFESVPFHNGFGLINIQGIAKPAYRAFELLHQAGNQSLPVKVEDPNATTKPSAITSFSTMQDGKLQIFISNWEVLSYVANDYDDRVIVVDVSNLDNVPDTVELLEINDKLTNPLAIWQSWGSPESPNKEQSAKLDAASKPVPRQVKVQKVNGTVAQISFNLPIWAVAVIRF